MSTKTKRALLCVVAFLFWFAQYIYNPHMTPFLLGLGISASFAGVIIGAYGFTQVVARFPLGISADHLQKHRVFIILGMFFAGLASVIRYFFPTPYMLLLANLVSGLASSMWISFTILYSCYYEKHELSKAMGLLVAVNNLGTLTAYIVGGLLVEKYGMGLLFLLSAAAGLIGMVIALFVRDEPVSAPPLPVKTLLLMVKNKRLLIFSFLSLLYHIILFATANSFTSKIVESLGASGMQISVVSALFMASAMFSAWFVGTKPAQAFGERKMMVLCFVLLAVYAFLVPRAGSVGLIMVLQLVGGLGSSSLVSLQMSNAIKGIPYEARSTGMGFFQSVYGMGIMLGPIIMGALVDATNYTISYTIIAVLAGLCTLLTLWFTKNIQEDQHGI